MAWVRVGPGHERLVNLDGFVHVQVVELDGKNGSRWAVEGLLRDGSAARLLEGVQEECRAFLEEVAQAVWAIGVGAPAQVAGLRGAHPYGGSTEGTGRRSS
ncbi:MAG: hypothetical protein QOG43_1105 [Actinomycetota bacterium]|jgi:hypothetical protein|nr:hypothetical protein [Actinomycetota bacterium]